MVKIGEISMDLNFHQMEVLKENKTRIMERIKLDSAFLNSICISFEASILDVAGIGGTRLVIQHPIEEDWIIKIAFSSEGIEGNRDELNTYKSAPENRRHRIGETFFISDDGVILEMRRYTPFESEDDLEMYAEEIADILKDLRFIHYRDPPYYHSFGLDGDGNVVVIDFGETEAIEWL
jgi:hypothetical protein